MRNIGAQGRAVSWNEQKYTSKTCVCIWHRLHQQCFCNRNLLVRVKWTNVWVTSHLKKKKIIIMSQPTCILRVLSTPIRMLQTVHSRGHCEKWQLQRLVANFEVSCSWPCSIVTYRITMTQTDIVLAFRKVLRKPSALSSAFTQCW